MAKPATRAPRGTTSRARERVDTSNVGLTPARPDNLSPATSDDLEASGAMVEKTIKDRVDTTHPAVDDEPRKGMPETANRIDFNDPTKSGAEAVAENLKNRA